MAAPNVTLKVFTDRRQMVTWLHQQAREGQPVTLWGNRATVGRGNAISYALWVSLDSADAIVQEIKSMTFQQADLSDAPDLEPLLREVLLAWSRP